MAILSKALSIIYDGVNIEKFNLVLAEINSSDSVVINQNMGSYSVAQEKAGSSDVFNIISEEFTDCIKFTIQLFDKEGKAFKQSQIEEINRLFFRKDSTYRKLQFIDDTYSGIYYLAKCNEAPSCISVGGNIVGFELSFVTNAPYAYSLKDTEITFSATNGTVKNIMDTNSLIGESFPDMIINFTSNGSFILTNEMTGKTMEIKNCVTNEKLTINGYTKEFKSSVRDVSSLFESFNYTWFSIGNTYESKLNKITYKGTSNCEITIKYTPNRLMGV